MKLFIIAFVYEIPHKTSHAAEVKSMKIKAKHDALSSMRFKQKLKADLQERAFIRFYKVDVC